MIEIKEALALVPTVLGNIKSIKEACTNLDAGILPNNRKKLKDLEELVISLESKMQSGFPVLANLATVYSSVAADVKVAWALSEKNYELLGFVNKPDYIISFLIRFPGEMERNYIDVSKGISDLPTIDNTESGEVRNILSMIGTYLDRLRQIEFDDNDDKSVYTAKDNVRKLVKDITSRYGDLDRVLSRLLKRILENIGKTKT
jgi:hypothetical protein